MINLETRVKIPETVLFQDLSGEMVLLELESGKYFGLNEVGTRLFALLSEGKSLGEACAVMMDEYEVSEEQLQGDVVRIVEKLVEQKLVVEDGEAV